MRIFSWIIVTGTAMAVAFAAEKSNPMVVVTAADATSQFSCLNKPNDLYRDDNDHSIFYQCYQDTKRTFYCSQGYVFNVDTGKCEGEAADGGGNYYYRGANNAAKSSRNVTGDVRKQCAQQTDGVYLNYNAGCREYYRCQNNQPVSYDSCQQNYRYDVRISKCVPKDDVICVSPTCPSDSDKTLTMFSMPETGCRIYFHCQQDGSRIDLRCPSGKYFNSITQECTTVQRQCSDIVNVCNGRPDGLYPDTTHDCRRYFRCRGGQIILLSVCSDGFKYNGNACVEESLTECPPSDFSTIKRLECLGKPEGLHADVESGCKRYFQCRNGLKISTFKCPGTSVFNGRVCVPPSEFKSCGGDDDDNETNSDDTCRYKEDGYHPDLGCRGYYYCLGGHPLHRKTCGEGTLFNGKMCVPHQLVRCTASNDSNHNAVAAFSNNQVERRRQNPCLNQKDGYLVDYLSGCTDYYYCFGGNMLFRARCEDAIEIFNGTSCVNKAAMTCDGPQLSPDCSDKETGLYPDRRGDCKRYHYCSNGYKVQLTCPENEIFDGNQCVSTDDYTCPNVDDDPDTCDGKTDGYYADAASACRSYYYCSQGLKLTYVCPPRTLFDGQRCESDYQCPYQVSRDCVGKTNGYYPNVSSGCRRYFYCLDEEKVNSFRCDGPKIFDGTRCVDDDNDVCPHEECYQKDDGFHPDVREGCRVYHHCSSQRKISTFTCPPGNVFVDGTCADEKRSGCPSLPSLSQHHADCASGESGFFTEQGSHCQKYFFCINGMKTSATCPGPQVFNGDVCVDPSEFHCPDVSCNNKADGPYPDIKSNCENYFVCSSGLLVNTYKCPSNLVFNGANCVPKSEFACQTDLCMRKRNGFYIHPNSQCRRYYYCLDGVQIKSYMCPRHLLFDGQQCVDAIRSPCLKDDNPCPESVVGYFADYASNCSKFHSCSNGLLLHTFTCPAGFLFQQQDQKCRLACDVKCSVGNA